MLRPQIALSGINNRNTRKKKLYVRKQENLIKNEIPFIYEIVKSLTQFSRNIFSIKIKN